MQKHQQKCVIQVLPALNSGGVERGTLEISEYLVKKGWRSVVISSGGKLVNRLTRNGTKHINLQTNSKNPLKWNNLRKKLKNVFEDEKPDIIHVRSRVPAWTAGKVAKKMNIPLISTIHGSHLASSLLKKYYNSASVNADKIIAISDYVKNNILKNNPEKKDIIKVIHRGADIEMFNPENIQIQKIPCFVTDGRLPARTRRGSGNWLDNQRRIICHFSPMFFTPRRAHCEQYR